MYLKFQLNSVLGALRMLAQLPEFQHPGRVELVIESTVILLVITCSALTLSGYIYDKMALKVPGSTFSAKITRPALDASSM